MSYLRIGTQIGQIERDYSVEIADTPDLYDTVHRIRYEVFCLDNAFFAGDPQYLRESDRFDDHSTHLLLRDRRHGEFIGTVRLIRWSPNDPDHCFLMQRFCLPADLADIPLETSAEVSRFALLRGRYPTGLREAALPRIALMRGVLALSRTLGLTHWLAVMEPSLIRLLRATGMHFNPLGPTIEYHGRRQPSVASIAEALAWGRTARPDIHAAMQRPAILGEPLVPLSGRDHPYGSGLAWLPAARLGHTAQPSM